MKGEFAGSTTNPLGVKSSTLQVPQSTRSNRNKFLFGRPGQILFSDKKTVTKKGTVAGLNIDRALSEVTYSSQSRTSRVSRVGPLSAFGTHESERQSPPIFLEKDFTRTPRILA